MQSTQCGIVVLTVALSASLAAAQPKLDEATERLIADITASATQYDGATITYEALAGPSPVPDPLGRQELLLTLETAERRWMTTARAVRPQISIRSDRWDGVGALKCMPYESTLHLFDGERTTKILLNYKALFLHGSPIESHVAQIDKGFDEEVFLEYAIDGIPIHHFWHNEEEYRKDPPREEFDHTFRCSARPGSTLLGAESILVETHIIEADGVEWLAARYEYLPTMGFIRARSEEFAPVEEAEDAPPRNPGAEVRTIRVAVEEILKAEKIAERAWVPVRVRAVHFGPEGRVWLHESRLLYYEPSPGDPKPDPDFIVNSIPRPAIVADYSTEDGEGYLLTREGRKPVPPGLVLP